ncbi:MAG: tetratricopeptide repeat protein [Chloroflexota bacterium]
MTAKKLVPLLIVLLGIALVIAAFVVWLEPPAEGGVFSVAGGIISFLAGLGASIKGWKDLLKKDESEKQELKITGDVVQGDKIVMHPKDDPTERQKTVLPRWGERNKDAFDYFISLCDEINNTDEDRLMATLQSWQVIEVADSGWRFSIDGALLLGPNDRLPSGFHTDVLLEEKRTTPATIKTFNGRCLVAMIKNLQEILSELWKDSWEDPLSRDELGRPRIINKYPQTAIIEAMVNFIIHRDYSVDDLAFITITDNFIEFTNPGLSPYSPQELLSLKKELHPKYQRNNLIIDAISRARLNQRQGSGIIRIRETLTENGNFLSDGKIGLEIENITHKNRFRLRIYQREQPPQLTFTPTLPLQSFFFGREKELATIASALSPNSRTWGALIDGPGGIGKTALAIKAAHDASAELFERKIFITAKVRELTAEGEAKLTDFTRPTYLAMLDELGKELGADGLEKLAPEARPNELRLALAGKKALIIFDNLETLPEDERTRLFQFLSRLPEGNKAIVTSRRRADVDARIVRLDRLARDEALQLIAELAAKTPRLARASQKEREDLYEITQGNPLFIRWITGQLGREGSQCRTIADACAFIDKAPKGNDPLEYIFGDLLETFTADETKVLAALTYFSLPAKLKWIADMTDLPARAAETALEDLTDRSILVTNYESHTYVLPPLTAKFIRTRRPEAVTETGDALEDQAYALALQYGGYDNYEGFRMLDAEWEFVSAALPRLLAGNNNRLQTACNQLYQFLNFTGRWDDLIWLFEQAEERALATNDKENAGWNAYRAGMIFSFRNQPAEVLACATRLAKHWLENTPWDKAFAIRLRGLGHQLNKDYPAAIAAYRESLDILLSIAPNSNDVATALNDLASVERNNKDYPAAERDYREALYIARRNNNQEHIATRLGNLSELALDREQWAEAESLAREALALDEKVGRQELIALDCHRLAQALLKQNVGQIANLPLQEALSLSRRAVEIFTRLRHRDLPEAQETLAEIEEKIKENRE